MENHYTIAQISTACNVSKQSLYRFINKNKTFIDENSIRNHRIVYYNQTAFDFFLAYYRPEAGKETPTGAERPLPEGEQKNPVEAPKEDKAQEPRQEDLQRKIDALEAEIGALRKQLDDKEDERKELLRQNGALILTISQQQLLLPAPKKNLTDRIKALFRKA